jgi:hypothetical protein
MAQVGSALKKWTQYKYSTAYFYAVSLGDGSSMTNVQSVDNSGFGGSALPR